MTSCGQCVEAVRINWFCIAIMQGKRVLSGEISWDLYTT